LDYIAHISGQANLQKKKKKSEKNSHTLQVLVSKDKPTVDRTSLPDQDKAMIQVV
jgi:hypothetical protein